MLYSTASAEDQVQVLAAQPRDRQVCFGEVGGQQQGVMGPLLEANLDVVLADGHDGGRVDEVAEQVPRLGRLVAVADAAGQQAIQAAGHEGQLQVAGDLQRHRTGQSVHVKEVDAVLDVVLD